MPSHVLRSIARKRMEEKLEKNVPCINEMKQNDRQIKVPRLNMDDLKKQSHMFTPPRTQPVTGKSSSGRWDCLCSPTTHAGSFRCRRHRSSEMRHTRSVGSNLSAMSSED